jgi:hypothetical protein
MKAQPHPHYVMPHHRAPLRLSRNRRYGVYAIGGTLWLSGAAWLVLHYLLMRAGPFGDEPHPLEPWALRLHAAMAFASIWTFGLVWGAHIVLGWRTRRHRVSGGLAVALLGGLIATGYLLYYLGDDQWRSVNAIAHWAAGLALPLLLAVHIVRGRRRARGSAQRPGLQ